MRLLLASAALSFAALCGAPALAQSSAVGSWAVAAETPQGKREGTLTVTEADGAYAVSFEAAPAADGAAAPAGAVSDVAVDGDSLSFKRSITTPQGEIELTYALTVAGDSLSGTATSSFGEVPVTGTRK